MTDPTKTHAIFVPNLSMNATVEQLEVVFNNFGPIKHNGIQVKVARYVSYLTWLTPFRFLIYNDVHLFFLLLSSIQQQGTCFGFVEFESASLMQSAIELTMTEGGFQDGLVIEMIALGAVETSVVGILAEAGAMGEMTLRGEVISQIELVVMLDRMKKLAIGSTKMVDGKATHQASQGSMS